MRKLFRANFYRLIKNKVFWGCVLCMGASGACTALYQYKNAPIHSPDAAFFVQSVLTGLVAALFCGLFLGTELDEGGLRNKLIAGHTRNAVFLSGCVTCICVCVSAAAGNLIAVAAVGVPLLGPVQMPLASFAYFIFVSLTLAAVYCTLFASIGLNLRSKAHAVTAMLLALLALFTVAVLVNAKLDAPQYFDNYVYANSVGGGEYLSTPNPAYIEGTVREIYQFVLDLLPTGQAIQLANTSAVHAWRLPILSLALALFNTFVGLAAFSKKNIV